MKKIFFLITAYFFLIGCNFKNVSHDENKNDENRHSSSTSKTKSNPNSQQNTESSDKKENESNKTIPLLYTNDKGETIISEIPTQLYKQKVGSAQLTVHDSLLPVLQEQNVSESQWALRTASVGIGVSLEWGIGDWYVSVLPRIRFIFTNHKNPPLP